SLRRRAELDEASPAELARLAAEDAGLGEFDAAAELYRRALQLSYGRVEWRLERARALAAAGRTDEALDEARRCLRLRPEFAAAEQLAAELSAGNP
ncbi:MAG TPA: tetratricopeptide repeat protein, partial [Lacipirellulaceae bacterium]|nr:tetratricopeptide repeat protein [Lacipirellulaceae bacterium]